MLFGTFKLDFRQGDLSFCDGFGWASEKKWKYWNISWNLYSNWNDYNEIKEIWFTFDGFHRTHYIRFLNGRPPVVNFGITFVHRIVFNQGISDGVLAFTFCIYYTQCVIYVLIRSIDYNVYRDFQLIIIFNVNLPESSKDLRFAWCNCLAFLWSSSPARSSFSFSDSQASIFCLHAFLYYIIHHYFYPSYRAMRLLKENSLEEEKKNKNL